MSSGGTSVTPKVDSQDLSREIQELHILAEQATTTIEFQGGIHRLSRVFENRGSIDQKKIFATSNLYVGLILKVFANKTFRKKIRELHEIITTSEDSRTDLAREEKIFLNTALTLAFFPLAVALPFLTEANIGYVRKIVSNFLGSCTKDLHDLEVSYVNLCFNFEAVVWNFDFQNKNRGKLDLDIQFLFGNLRKTRAVAAITFLTLPINSLLAEQLRSALHKKPGSETIDIVRAMNSIHGSVFKIEKGISNYLGKFQIHDQTYLQIYSNHLRTNNEKNLLYFISQVSHGYKVNKQRSFHQAVLDKVEGAKKLQAEFSVFARKNLAAFTGNLRGEEREWANKVFIISHKTIATLAEISTAKDEDWRFAVAVRELSEWLHDTHEILNYYNLEDDFALIAHCLREESLRVEWKSSFFTPIEQETVNEKADLAKGRELLMRIVKTVLGMLNTEGGTILVGLVEHPGRVVRTNFLSQMHALHGKTFLNIDFELKEKERTLDDVRLQILDNLKSLTQLTEDKFNDLFVVEPVLLRATTGNITIVKISVKKSATPIFNVKEDNNVIWISLTKRAEGKTIDVDARDYLTI